MDAQLVLEILERDIMRESRTESILQFITLSPLIFASSHWHAHLCLNLIRRYYEWSVTHRCVVGGTLVVREVVFVVIATDRSSSNRRTTN